MKKKLLFLLGLVCLLLVAVPAWADEVDYRILSYDGDLVLHADNTADFTQRLVYHFDSDYNGQYVTLGEAGVMPAGFAIASSPQVQVEKNGQAVEARVEEENLSKGKRLKIYNAGQESDQVQVNIHWKLSNLLSVYSDIAQLKWVPISDWDQDLEQLHLRVTGLGTDGTLLVNQGYFAPAAQIKKIEDGYEIGLGHLAAGRKVELFGYFPARLMAENLRGSQVGLPQFQATQAKLVADQKRLSQLLYLVTPISLFSLFVLALLMYLLFRHKARPSQSFNKKARLYEAPNDWSPFVVADHVFATRFADLDPTRKAGKRQIGFQSLVQASLLDLLDRGFLRLENEADKPRLHVLKREGLPAAEAGLVQMAFSAENALPVDQLFQDYQISESLYKGKNRLSEYVIRQKGEAVKQSLSSQIGAIADAVDEEVAAQDLSALYRPLTLGEQVLFSLAMLLLGAIFCGAVGFLLAALNYELGDLVAVYAAMLAIFGLTIWTFWSRTQRLRSDGVLTDEGVETYYHWHSFRNMLRDIAQLDKAEVESIVLWNRLLVYATLFGYADRVSHVMKIRQIQLANDDLNLYVSLGWHQFFYANSASLAHYGQVANTASTFSVSSSGSVGGGFAGGGGGGGGGAF